MIENTNTANALLTIGLLSFMALCMIDIGSLIRESLRGQND